MQMCAITAAISRLRWSAVLTAATAVLTGVLVAGCGSSVSAAAQAHQLEQQYPWLASLGLSFVEWLIKTYGSDIAALLVAALAAL